MFIDKFRRKRKNSEHRKDRKENNKKENIFFFFVATKSAKHKSQKETKVESEEGWEGVKIVEAMCEGVSENSLKN